MVQVAHTTVRTVASAGGGFSARRTRRQGTVDPGCAASAMPADTAAPPGSYASMCARALSVSSRRYRPECRVTAPPRTMGTYPRVRPPYTHCLDDRRDSPTGPTIRRSDARATWKDAGTECPHCALGAQTRQSIRPRTGLPGLHLPPCAENAVDKCNSLRC